jgi:hypothetical protein
MQFKRFKYPPPRYPLNVILPLPLWGLYVGPHDTCDEVSRYRGELKELKKVLADVYSSSSLVKVCSGLVEAGLTSDANCEE